MRIKIAAKLRPFSHRPGVCCLIPYTTWEVQVFPAKLCFRDLSTGGAEEVITPVEGPVKGFTVVSDLERGRIEVFGRARSGYFRTFITADSHPFLTKIELPECSKRLSLGCHKKQDWELVERRAEMSEVFPFWLRLAQLVPETALVPIGTGELIAEGKLELAFRAAFQGILCPRLEDENHLGIIPETGLLSNISPLGILHEGARRIERLFFFEGEGVFHFLPSLPKEFHAGRFINVTTSAGDSIDMEWSKKQLKKVVIRAASSRIVHLHLQSQIRRFRVMKKMVSSDQPIALEAGTTLFLDRFMF